MAAIVNEVIDAYERLVELGLQVCSHVKPWGCGESELAGANLVLNYLFLSLFLDLLSFH